MVQIRKAAGALGAWVEGVQVGRESDADYAQIDGALLEHQVLFFRDQKVTPADFACFAARFGVVQGHPAYDTVAGASEVQILESTAERPTKIEKWHTDMTFGSTPPMATLLHAQVVPAWGGDTLWTSATAAYEALSESMKALLDGLVAVHDFRVGFKESLAEPGGQERLADAVRSNPPVQHPVIRTHPRTGKKAIYVNSLFTSHIRGLTAMESRALLDFLYAHIQTDEFTVRFSWEQHSLVIWDNRVTQHKPINDYFPQHRKLHRITIDGDRPQ